MENKLNKYPLLYSFIIYRKEEFGGYLFNRYVSEPIPLNHIGARIVELCDGTRNVQEITQEISREEQIPLDSSGVIVTSAIKTFNENYCLKWLNDRASNPSTLIYHHPDQKGFLSAPLYVLWDITYACNLRCKHCLSSSGERLEKELSYNEVTAIIDQLAKFKIFNLSFLGGEPLMRKDFFDILAYSSKYDFNVTFSTNGYLVDDNVIARLKKIDVFSVQISLDGLESTHDSIRGVPTSYEKAINACRQLTDSGIRVTISTVINKQNLHELEDLVKLSIEIGATSYKAIPFMPVGRGKDAQNLDLTHRDMKNFIIKMMEIREKYQDDIQFLGEKTYTWLLEPEPKVRDMLDGDIQCIAGTQQIVISSTGNIFPCPFLHDFVAGNLLERPMEDIWSESEVLSLFRNIKSSDLKGKCSNCGYVPLYCKGGCRAAAYIISGDIYGEDPMCWYNLEPNGN